MAKKAAKKKATKTQTVTRRPPPDVNQQQAPTPLAKVPETKAELLAAGIETQAEGLALALAVAAKANVEARYKMAMAKPRNEEQARALILQACKRTRFAQSAMYRFPVGGDKFIEGLSIRFAEEAIRLFQNIVVMAQTLYEDDDTRTVGIQVIDLEANISYSTQVTLKKTIERRYLKKDQVAIAERTNSSGQRLFILEATEQDMAAKTNSAISKAIRTQGLRLIPADIKEEAWDLVQDGYHAEVTKDPTKARKAIEDGFMELGVDPKMLTEYLGQKLSTASPAQIVELRKLYASVRDGQTTWPAIAAAKAAERLAAKEAKDRADGKKPDQGSLNGLSPGDDKSHTKPGDKLEKPPAGQQQPPGEPGQQPSLL